MTAPTVPTAPLPSELPPAAYDKDYDRHYLPLPGGAEIQTKGRGSSFRVVVGIGTKTEHRILIPDQPYVHETLERMARDIRTAVLAMRQERDDALSRCDSDLLTMQRERDQWKSRANIAAGIIETATEQLAASVDENAKLRAGLRGFVCNDEVCPTLVTFSDGSVVRLAHDADRGYFLQVETTEE